MLRQLPESRLAILDLLRFPLPPSLLPTFPLFLNSLSSFINTSDPGDVEKSKNREWRNIVFFLNFPTPPQEKPTTRHQHSTLNAPLSLSLDFQSNDISTPTLPSIPIFKGIGFLQSRKSSSARVSICFPLFSTRDLETCGRNQKRGGTAPRGSRRLRSPLIYFSTRVCSFSPKCRDPSSA